MRLEHDLTLQDYLDAGSQTTAAFLESGTPFRAAVDNIYAYFVGTLLKEDADLRPVPAFLAINSFMLWLSSVRMAATGHSVAVYPLFRVALESACYSLLMQKDTQKEVAWNERDSGSEMLNRCREAFTSAAKDAAKEMNSIQPGSGDMVLTAYQSAIDFGAHPNAKSIYRNIQVQEDMDKAFWHLHMATIGSPESVEVRRALIASLEFSFVIGSVLLRTLPNVTQAQADALGVLHDEKEALIRFWSLEAP